VTKEEKKNDLFKIKKNKNMWDKIKENGWFTLGLCITVVFLLSFFVFAKPGSKYDNPLLGSGQQGGQEAEFAKSVTIQPLKKCTVKGSMKIDNRIPPKDEIAYIRPKHAPEIMTELLSGGIFTLDSVPVPKSGDIVIEVILKNEQPPIGALTTFITPDEKNVSRLQELLFEGKYNAKKQLTTIIQLNVKQQQSTQNGNGNSSIQAQ
jgi:hypothetical protein